MEGTGLFLNIVSALILGAHGHGHHNHGHGHDHNDGEDRDKHGDDHKPRGASKNIKYSPSARRDPESQHGHSTYAPNTALSMRAVFLHVAADALNNIAVMVAAVIIW